MKKLYSELNDPLLLEGNRILDTLTSLEPGLKIQYNTAPLISGEIKVYRQAALDHEAAIDLRTKTLMPEQNRLDRNGSKLISKIKNVLKPELGPDWNQRWTEPGFLEGSITTPKNLAERIKLLRRLGVFLAGHPQFEVEKHGITAVNAEDLFTSLTAIGEALSKHETTESQLSSARKTAKAALQKRLRGLRGELSQVLADDDQRWGHFGYTSPAERREARQRIFKAKAEAKAAANPTAAVSPSKTRSGSVRVATPATAPDASNDEAALNA